MTNIGSSNMIHRLRQQMTGDERLFNCHQQLHSVLNSVAAKAKAAANTECLDFSCTARPIESHVIPDSFLRRLAGTRSVMTPHLEGGSIGSFDPMSKKTKPVFAGYCGKHDRALFPWETDGDLSRPLSAESQLMRVADAMWIEYELRAKILAWAAEGISGAEIASWHRTPTAAEARILEIQHDSWRASSAEMLAASADIDGLRTSLRRNLGLLDDGGPLAIVGSATVPAERGHFVLLADGAWIPDWHPLDGATARPAPFVISVLYDGHGTRLHFASTRAAEVPVRKMEHRFRSDACAAITFILHWMRRGNFYWYLNPEEWAQFDQETKDILARDLRCGPFISAAIYSNAGIEMHPVLRYGNGWG